MIYIQKRIQFWETEAALPPSYRTGATEEDYNNGAYLLLDAEQEAFHRANPGASPLECWNKAIEPAPGPSPELLLCKARGAKQQEIHEAAAKRYYVDERDIYTANTLRLKDRCARQAEVEVGGVAYPARVLAVALDGMDDYAEAVRAVSDGLLARVDQAATPEEVEAIEVTGFPAAIHTTTAELQAEADYRERLDPAAQALKVSRMSITTMAMDDATAIRRKYGHAEWSDFVGGKLAEGDRVLHDDWLWRVRQPVDPVLDIYPPSVDTASLYERMDEERAGTATDPKLYAPGMTLEAGLYYTEQVGGVRRKYYCETGTGQAVYAHLSELVGINVREVRP